MTLTDSTPATSDAPNGSSAFPVRRFLALIAGVALALVAVWFGLPRLLGAFGPHLYSGTVLQGDAPAPAFTGLVDADGNPYDLSAHEGEVVLIYFGYTHCPDVCPNTLNNVAQARKQLGDDADAVNVVMVGVDPARDDPASLGQYVGFFDPTFTAATGAESDVEAVASAYGVFYEYTEPDADGDYTVDHTATLMGIDAGGALRILWPPEIDADLLAADLAELLP